MFQQPSAAGSVLLLCSGLVTTTYGQEIPDTWPQTRAESTDYRETSRYQDVIDFIEALQSNGAPLSVQFIGASTLGRRIPMVIAGRPVPAGPAMARRLNRPIVCVQANIHAGEVEGKEASLMLLRDLARSRQDDLLERLTLMVLPIYNIDGNESLGPQSRNRARQFGPELVGVRHNGQGLDLNRDYVKLEAPETRAVVRSVFTTWDPDVYLDLHTTNGTLHGYQLTYSPPLHPDTANGILTYTRDDLLVQVRNTMRARHGLEIFDYGNTPRWNFKDRPFAWYTNRPEPRYGTNYVGLRNRIGILSEAMSHVSFKDRVDATYRFVRLILERVAKDAHRVIELTRQADLKVTRWGRNAQKAPKLGLRFDFASRGRETVLLDRSETSEVRDKRPKDRPPGPPTDILDVEMEIYDRFRATRTRRYPRAYLFGPDISEVARLLSRHGVVVERIRYPWQGPVESFTIDTIEAAERPYQGHRLLSLEGTFASRKTSMPAGSYLARTAQPLGILLFQLLEPESLDGVAAWNLLDRQLRGKGIYPIVKCYETIDVPTETLNEDSFPR